MWMVIECCCILSFYFFSLCFFEFFILSFVSSWVLFSCRINYFSSSSLSPAVVNSVKVGGREYIYILRHLMWFMLYPLTSLISILSSWLSLRHHLICNCFSLSLQSHVCVILIIRCHLSISIHFLRSCFCPIGSREMEMYKRRRRRRRWFRKENLHWILTTWVSLLSIYTLSFLDPRTRMELRSDDSLPQFLRLLLLSFPGTNTSLS